MKSGEEIGTTFEPYREVAPVLWDDPNDSEFGIPVFWNCAASIHSPLRSRAVRLLGLEPADQVLAYLRPGVHPDRTLLVLLNYGARDPGGDLRSLAPEGNLMDLLLGERFSARESAGSSTP